MCSLFPRALGQPRLVEGDRTYVSACCLYFKTAIRIGETTLQLIPLQLKISVKQHTYCPFCSLLNPRTGRDGSVVMRLIRYEQVM